MTKDQGVDRRTVLLGSVGAMTSLALASCGIGPAPFSREIGPRSAEVRAAEKLRRRPGQRLVTQKIVAQPTTVDLGTQSVETWAYGEGIPGPLIRTTAGDLLRVELTNQLPTDTSVHWHGVAMSNDMDGVPGMTQEPIGADSTFTYEFTTTDPGTYFFHPHTGVQLDRGLYGVLVVDDPHEEGKYDQEWIVVLDDWIDGTGQTPDDVLDDLTSMAGMGHGGMGDGGMMDMERFRSPYLGGAGDVDYPLYLVNGRVPESPDTLRGKPGQRARIRIINAGSDTAFRVALGGHRMTVTHSDGFPLKPVTTDALMIGMGERYDVTVELRDGVFPLVAAAEGKSGTGLAVVRTGAGAVPVPDAAPPELSRRVLMGTDLMAADDVRLESRRPARRLDVVAAGGMMPYRWTINGKRFPNHEPLVIEPGERARLRFRNTSRMFHPMHLHGHTFGLVAGGARKDTVIVPPKQTIDVDVEADNPGQWALHCHNIYHAEAGMMTVLSYRTS